LPSSIMVISFLKVNPLIFLKFCLHIVSLTV